MKRISDISAELLATRRSMVKAGVAATGAGVAGIGIARFGGSVSAQDAQSSPPAGGPPEQGGGPGGGGDETLDAFVGVTTDGTVIDDLYDIEATGAPTDAVREAATAFLDALTDDQRAATLFAVDDDEWRRWSNVDSYTRQGTSLRDMTDDQKAAAMALLEASLSASGYEKTENIMKLNHTEGELMNDFDGFDEDLYWFTVMGEPSETDPWGWQLDGHHLVINYFILGDQVVMAPVFMGSEPTVAPDDTDYAGLSVLLEEQGAGLTLAQSLTDEQRAKAIISAEKTGEDLQAGANSDNAVIAYAGINAADLTAEQQTLLMQVVTQYVENLEDSHAAVKLEEVEAHLADTWFAWIGATDDDAVFYYRIQSPVILIEFDHQPPGPLGRASDYYQGASGPQRMHVHTVMRTPNGNDYGKDLLAEHYATSAHHQGTSLGMPIAGAAVVGGYLAARQLLPPRYWGNRTVSSAPMPAAELVYGADGSVAWNEIWGDFCELAIAGGPSHRGTLLEPPAPAEVLADPENQRRVLDELERGLSMVTGWEVRRDLAPGWIGLVCPDEDAAVWLLRAILVENLCVRREGATLCLPAGPTYQLTGEIKNVVTAVAKTHHYWTEHVATLAS